VSEPELRGDEARAARYWRSNLRLVAVLMMLGFVVTFVASYFAPALAGLMLFGLPLPFFMAARGAVLVYVLLVCVYAWRMRALDRQYAQTGERDPE
jgi:putative solute:sodium symporter small subunit